MISTEMTELGRKRSVIRELFEYGKQRSSEIGAENVFDFSIGNPSVPAPAQVNACIRELLDTTPSVQLHGYTSAQGDMSVRKAIADSIYSRFSFRADPNLIYMTAGAAASLTITLKAIVCPENKDEVIVIAPYFPEYKVFINMTGAGCVIVPPKAPDFQIDLTALEAAITSHTKAVIVNSPNNPSGVVYTKETMQALCRLLKEKSEQRGEPIYLISDEPYRELTYGAEVAYLPLLYKNTIVCYSFSKSLSLPGERIGYILISPACCRAAALFQAVCGAGRALGFVCAPSLFQYVIKSSLNADISQNVEIYRNNRDILYNSLVEMGYECVYPDGAFYLFVKSPEPDANAFSERAKKHELLIVPGDDFGCPGYVRISYCVREEMIRRSLPAFRALIEEYRQGF